MTMPPDYRETEDVLGAGDNEPFEDYTDYGICNHCQFLDENGRCHNPKWNLGKQGMLLKPYRHEKCRGYIPAKYHLAKYHLVDGEY